MYKKLLKTDLILDNDYDIDNHLQTREQIDAKFKEFLNSNKQSTTDLIMRTEGTKPTNLRITSLQSGTSVLTPKHGVSTLIENKSITSNSKYEGFTDGTNDNDMKRANNRRATSLRQTNLATKEYDEYTLRLFKDFGISIMTLNQLPTHEEKEIYILENLRKTLNNELEEWEKKRKASKLKNMKLDEDYEKNRIRWIKEKADIFEWLNVRTKYGDLKKKLRASLVNNVNDIGNVNRIEEFFNTLDSLKKSQDKIIISSTFRIDLEGVPMVNNTEILKEVLGSDQSIFKVTRKFKKKPDRETILDSLLSRQTQQPQNLSTNILSTIRPSTANSALNSKKINFNKDENISQALKQKSLLNEEEEAKIEKEIKESYHWNDESENKFLAYRNDAKHRLFNQAKSSSWNEVGFSSMVHQSHMTEKNKKQRETLFQKYRDGQGLSEQDYKFLAETNTLLQSCVDKNELQTTIKYLNPEIIESHEINIAENILHDYQKMRKQIREARSEYLAHTNEEKMKNVQKKHLVIEKKSKIVRGRTEQKRIKKKILNYLNKQEEKKQWKSVSPEKININSVGKFATKLLGNIQQNLNARNMQKQADMLEKLGNESVHGKIINKKKLKHKYHPPSKILIPEEANNRMDYLGLPTNILDAKVSKRKNDDAKLYKLNIHCPPQYKNATEFAKFYSGGPKSSEEFFNGNYAYISNDFKYPITAEKLKAITKIQALIRGGKSRKNFRLMKEEFEKTRKMLSLKKNNEPISSEAVLKHLRTMWKINNEEGNSKVENPKEIEKNKAYNDHFEQLYQAMHNQITISDNDSFMNDNNEGAKKISHPTSPNELSGIKGLIAVLRPKFDKILNIGTKKSNNPHSNSGPIVCISSLKMPRIEIKPTESAAEVQQPKSEISDTQKSIDIQTDRKRSKGASSARPKTATATANLFKKITKISKDRPSSSKSRDVSAISSEKEVPEENRMERIAKRPPPKGLLLKQRKLLSAARQNNLDMVLNNAFTYFESDVNVKDDKGNTPLYYAAKHGNLKFCQFLLDRGARVNEFCEHNNTPLHMGFSSHQEMLVIMLISKGGNLNTLNEYGQTPLAFGSERILELLDLKNGVATYERSGSDMLFLPRGLDNNKLIDRNDNAKRKPDYGLLFEPNKIKSPTDKLIDNKQLSSYIPGNFISTKDMSTNNTE